MQEIQLAVYCFCSGYGCQLFIYSYTVLLHETFVGVYSLGPSRGLCTGYYITHPLGFGGIQKIQSQTTLVKTIMRFFYNHAGDARPSVASCSPLALKILLLFADS